MRDSVCWAEASMFFPSQVRLTSWSTVHPRLWWEHKSCVTTMQAIKYHRAVQLRRKYIFKKFHWDLWNRSCFFLFEKYSWKQGVIHSIGAAKQGVFSRALRLCLKYVLAISAYESRSNILKDEPSLTIVQYVENKICKNMCFFIITQ